MLIPSVILVQCICDPYLLSTEIARAVYMHIEPNRIISFPDFVQAFLVVVPHKKSVFNRILKASRCHPKCNFVMVCLFCCQILVVFSKIWY